MMMRICIPFLLLVMGLLGLTTANGTLRLRLDDDYGLDGNLLGVEQNNSTMPTVQTSSGKVVGVREEVDGLRIYSFKGIPYGADTSGENRCRAPRDPESWRGNQYPRNATDYGPICPQESTINVDAITNLTGVEADITVNSLPPSAPLLMSEDCLRINVFSPSLNQSAKAPVMLYIHGGGFTGGSGNGYPSNSFAAKGVILVTFNYRLNMLGYFAHPSLEATNFGLLDQIKAIEWVVENIENFGGDASRITVFGEDAGATSVMAMLVSPLSKGLFQGAISESGTIVQSLNLTMAEASSLGEAVGEALDVPAGANQLEIMRNLPAESLISSNQNIQDALEGTFPLFLYIDDMSLTTSIGEAFNSPAEANCYHKGLPLIIGSNANEMSFFQALQEQDASNSDGDSTAFRSSNNSTLSGDSSYFLGDFSFFPDTVEEYEKAVTDTFQNAYEVRSLFPASTDEGALQAGMDIKSATVFGFPSYFVAKTIAEQGGDAYLYHFSEKPTGTAGEHLGTFHTSELPYVFNTTTSSGEEGHNRAFLTPVANADLAQTMIDYWTEFARTGDPNQESLPKWKGMKSCPTCRYNTRQSAKAKWNLLGPDTGLVAVPWKHEESYRLVEPIVWEMINGKGTWFESQSA